MQLKEMRTKKGLTQKQLAEKAGVSITMVNLIERGKVNATVKTFQKLADALNCDLKKLF